MKNKLTFTLVLVLIAYLLFSQEMIDKKTETRQIMESNMALATFGNGCFWCTEAIFEQLKGVENVVPGYAGGNTKNPTYEEVSSGLTGYAEVIQMSYDPKIIRSIWTKVMTLIEKLYMTPNFKSYKIMKLILKRKIK